jgi:hypothetical protein
MNLDVLVRLEDPAIAQHQAGHNTQVFRRRPGLPGQRDNVAAAEQAALPRAAQIIRTNIPRRERRLDAVGIDLQSQDVQRSGCLDQVVGPVARLEHDLQGIVSRLVVGIQAAGHPAQGDAPDFKGLRCLFGGDFFAVAERRILALQGPVVVFRPLVLVAQFVVLDFPGPQLVFQELFVVPAATEKQAAQHECRCQASCHVSVPSLQESGDRSLMTPM